MANRSPTREHDPGSQRLTPDQVVQIHLAHRAGESWHSIADRFGTRWKNVSRIINGDRWPDIHPSRRPDLYLEHANDAAMASVTAALDEIEQQIHSIRTALSQARTSAG